MRFEQTAFGDFRNSFRVPSCELSGSMPSLTRYGLSPAV